MKNIQDQFSMLSDRVTRIESGYKHQTPETPRSVEEDIVEEDRLSLTAGQTDENHETNTPGLDETSLAGFVPPLDNTELPVVEASDTDKNISNPDNNELLKTDFFDPEQTTAQRWAPSEPFGAFIENEFSTSSHY